MRRLYKQIKWEILLWSQKFICSLRNFPVHALNGTGWTVWHPPPAARTALSIPWPRDRLGLTDLIQVEGTPESSHLISYRQNKFPPICAGSSKAVKNPQRGEQRPLKNGAERQQTEMPEFSNFLCKYINSELETLWPGLTVKRKNKSKYSFSA